MNANQALWEKGDFTAIASLMRKSGEALVASLDVRPPLKALDLGCGDGTTAVPLAERGADTVGIDIARNLVAAGNARAKALGLEHLTFREGDACDLVDVPDHSFDLVLSLFGAMFAPKPFDVAKEMVRVTRPGGRIVMGNWIPNDPTSFVSQVLRISSAFTPPPPEGFVSPMTWGVESHIVERFSQAGVPADRIAMVRDTFRFATPDRTPEDLIDVFRRFYGPTMNAYEAAAKDGRVAELHEQLLDLARSQNEASDGGTSIGATSCGSPCCPDRVVQAQQRCGERRALSHEAHARVDAVRDPARAHEPPAVASSPPARASRGLLYTSPSPRDRTRSRMPSSA